MTAEEVVAWLLAARLLYQDGEDWRAGLESDSLLDPPPELVRLLDLEQASNQHKR